VTVAVAFATTAAVAWPAHASFGIAAFDQQVTADPAGDPYNVAGGHPYTITTEVDLNSHPEPEAFGRPMPDADVKDIIAELPQGLVGNPLGLPQCTMAQLTKATATNGFLQSPECPVSSTVGIIALRTALTGVLGSDIVQVYNMVPPVDEPAAFGFMVGGVPIIITGNVRNGGDHGIDVVSADITNAIPLTGFTLTFWGVPADPRHDAQRCDAENIFGLIEPELVCTGNPGTLTGPNAFAGSASAFITLPVSCTSPGIGFETTLQVDSWPEQGTFLEQPLFNHIPPGYPLSPSEWGPQQNLVACDRVPFKPAISVAPTNKQADTPSGLNVEISLPQEGTLNPEGIATSDVKKAVVTLPAGESVSPSAADGLGACSLEQIGLNNGNPAQCPDSSKLGTVEIVSPLLDVPLKGAVYLGRQSENPFGSLIAMYIVVEGHGVILKLPGRVDLDPVTGRIVTTFDNNPELPFDRLKLNFKAGPRSPLVNPHTCGMYETTAELTPWSGNPPVTVASAFQITEGPEGRPCPTGTQQAFAPSFVAGTPNNQAGAFSPMTVTFTRADGEQQLGGVTVKTPPGLLGMLSAVSLCGEPQASAGTCPASSEIGSVSVDAGAGANPFYVTGGKVFLTTAYKGGEFGLSVVVPAKAGPFDLGTVIVRGSVKIDPITTALTVTTDPLPTILDGIPLDLRTVNVQIDKPGFIFNPTNCNPLSLSALLTGGLGTTEDVTNPFQVTNCGRLGFAPRFSVTTPSRTSRARGAGLHVKLAYPKGAQANLAKVKVSLPKRLPSRLTTLQKACTAATFDANPANCPAASRIGTAIARTPVVPVPLTGPVYFVSHGGEAFPDLVIALQGYGVTFDLVGTTFINSKTNITSTTFKTVPDVPVGTFELTLPQGPNSALAAIGNLCEGKLAMPTAFVAQDGAEIHTSTPITPTGCPKHKAKKTRKAARNRHGGRSGKARRGR
jgi:hypothetical protein